MNIVDVTSIDALSIQVSDTNVLEQIVSITEPYRRTDESSEITVDVSQIVEYKTFKALCTILGTSPTGKSATLIKEADLISFWTT